MSEQNRAKKRRTDMSSAAAAVAMDASQQFHLKWNNHSLNTLSSFQNLLDTNTLVDVSLTASNGKTVTAHRMVLAACSDYFYRLFKDLPEKHPVIVFKDASEEIVSDLLLFMYKGEVEVQESHLNDFLKFADTLQVKGLSQSDREDISAKQQQDAAAAAAAMAMGAAAHGSPLKLEGSPIKINGPPAMAAAVSAALPTPPPPLPDMTKTYLAAAGLAKFPPIFPLPPGAAADPAAAAAVSATDLLSQFSSPNLYRALHNRNKQMGNPLAAAAAPGAKFNEADAALLGGMPPLLNLKKMFSGDKTMAAAAADLASLYPHPLPMRDDNDSDSIADHRSPPPAHQQRSSSNAGTPGPNDENGTGSDNGASPMEQDFSAPPSNSATESPGKGDRDGDNGTPQPRRGGSKPSAGRGSRLEKMIAAEYKIMSEYSENQGPNELPVMTPELMKSRRTHSLQLAIGEILHNRASVQSAATKYHIPRETLRRHYQRYLKTLGIARPPPPPGGGGSSQGQSGGGSGSAPTSGTNTPAGSAVRTAVATNNNATKSAVSSGDGASSADESSNGFSSLMDIGQAYGIWNPDLDPELKSKIKDETMRRMAAMSAVSAAAAAAAASGAEEKEKELVIDEDEDELDVGEEDDEFEDVDKGLGGERKNETEEEEAEREDDEKGDNKEPMATESSAAMETAA